MKKIKQLTMGISLSLALLSQLSFAQEEFIPAKQPAGYLHPMAISTNNIVDGAKGYRPWFENGSWQGDIVEYDVTSTGEISSSVDLSGLEPSNSTSEENWSARLQFDKKSADYWDTSRKIITVSESGQQVAFRWANLSASQKQALDSSNANATSSPILDFIRGDQSNEKPTGTLRQRYNLLGDIMHSNPIYVGAPNSNINESSYIAYRNANLNRAPRLYVGSNDGMLHVFDAETGDEVYAFIPPSLIPKLNNLASDPYTHQYFVDGELAVYDIYFKSAQEWRTILVGGLGAGGSTRFALDVTNPNLDSESSSANLNKKVLWLQEHTEANGLNGGTYGQSTLVKLNDGRYYSIVGNGYHQGQGVPQLILTDIETGITSKISTGRTSSTSPYGLSTPAVFYIDSDESYNYAYAGDLDGNLWKFNLTTRSLAYPVPLFSGNGEQPITTKPSVTSHPQGGKMVYFGTGKTLLESDLSDTTAQAIYGIWDNGAPIATNKLLTQTLSANTQINSDSEEIVKTLSNTPMNWAEYAGWHIELPDGLRVVTNHRLRAGRVQTVVTNPVTEENWLFEPAYLNGGAPLRTIFDINRDGLLNIDDNVEDGTIMGKTVSAWKLADGIMSGPVIVNAGEGIDIKYVNYEQLPLPPTGCTEDCNFIGGHIDVDTDNEFDGSTSVHTHEYDQKVNQPYVDYFTPGDGQLKVNNVITNQAQKFIVLIANADLSPKGRITIGKVTYNVVEYQRLIHKKLAEWNWNNNNSGLGDGSNLVDNNGNRLVHTLASLRGADGLGTLRNSFDSLSIVQGGLHPTNTNCITDKTDRPHITNDRWRNGSLTTHLIDINSIKSLDDLYLQTPSDLPTSVLVDGQQILLKEGDVTYGGLRANQGKGFLYESTLFWHYPGGSCYGEAGWEGDVAEARNIMIAARFDPILKDFNFNSLGDLILALKKVLEECGSDAQCQLDAIINESGKNRHKTVEDLLRKVNSLLSSVDREVTNLDDLIKLLEDLENGVEIGGGGDGGLGSDSGIPIIIEGGNDSTGVTAGPNYIKGRRTWTDITSH